MTVRTSDSYLACATGMGDDAGRPGIARCSSAKTHALVLIRRAAFTDRVRRPSGRPRAGIGKQFGVRQE
jgi:hypothetical protein